MWITVSKENPDPESSILVQRFPADIFAPYFWRCIRKCEEECFPEHFAYGHKIEIWTLHLLLRSLYERLGRKQIANPDLGPCKIHIVLLHLTDNRRMVIACYDAGGKWIQERK